MAVVGPTPKSSHCSGSVSCLRDFDRAAKATGMPHHDPLRTQCPRSTHVLHRARTLGSAHDAPQYFLRIAGRNKNVRLTAETRLVLVFTKGHVWTAPGCQGFRARTQRWSVQPCVRPL